MEIPIATDANDMKHDTGTASINKSTIPANSRGKNAGRVRINGAERRASITSLVKLSPSGSLVGSGSADDDVRKYVGFASDRRACDATQHRQLTDVGQRIGDGTL